MSRAQHVRFIGSRSVWLSAVALLALLAGACSNTQFERAPVAETDCDPLLPGDWDPVAGKGDSPPDFRLHVAAGCLLHVTETKPGAAQGAGPTRVHVGRHGDLGIAWVDGAWAATVFESRVATVSGDVFVVGYRVTPTALELQMPEDALVAKAIAGGEIPGETEGEGSGARNRITGGPHPEVLDRADFFSMTVARFRRAESKTP